MGIFGKILIVLNLLAMGGVAYIASLDWAKRQEWAFAALRREIAVVGLPVEASDAAPADLDKKEYAPFVFTGESGVYTEIKLADLGKIVPAGGEPWGSATVATQDEEVKRLEAVVFGSPGTPGILERDQDRRARLLTLHLNLAESGEERDGIFALLNGLSTNNRTPATRSELAYLAPGPSQQAALLALVAVSEYKRGLEIDKEGEATAPLAISARNSLIRLAVADLPYTIATVPGGGSRQDRYTTQKKLADDRSKPDLENLIKASQAPGTTEQQLENLRGGVVAKGADEREKAQLLRVAQLASNRLDTPAKINDAIKQLRELVLERKESDAEGAVLEDLIALIDGSVKDADLDAKILKVATDRLRLWFTEAQLPIAKPRTAGSLTGKWVQTEAEKRTRIAHLLTQIDADGVWPSPARETWHRRVSVIVGINYYASAIEAQANRIFAASQRVDQLILNEQNVFESRYSILVREAQYLADLLGKVEAQLVEQKRVVDEYQTDVNQRTGERDTLSRNLDTARKKAQESLAGFKLKQAELIDATKKLRDSQDSTGKLEEAIRKLESTIKGN